MLPGDFEIRRNKRSSGNPSQTDDDFWIHQSDLSLQPLCAGIAFLRQRISVFRRTTFDNVADINFCAVKPNQLEHDVQQLTRRADKWQTFQIFLFTRPFAYISSAMKLIVYPIAAYLLVYFIPGLDATFKSCVLVLSAVPSGAIILSLAELHRCEQENAASVLLMSSMLCAFTIPLVLLIL